MPSPTIVLIHGAFADASSWRPVYDRLVGDGHTVLAPPNPLRGINYDASFIASVIEQTTTFSDYLTWLDKGEYSAILADGSLLQLYYEIQAREVVRHRLAY